MVASTSPGPTLGRAGAAGRGRRRSGHPVRPRGLRAAFAGEADVLARQVLVTAEVPRSVERHRGHGRGHACRPPTARSPPRRSRRCAPAAPRPLADGHAGAPPSWAALRRAPAAARSRAGPRPWCCSSRAQDRDRRGPGQPVHRLADQVRRGRRAAARHRRRLRLGEGDRASMLRRNKDLDARISRRLEAAGSELKSVGVAAPARRHLLRQRPGRHRARRRQPVIGLLFLAAGAVRALDLPRASAGRGGARRSTTACPTPCS